MDPAKDPWKHKRIVLFIQRLFLMPQPWVESLRENQDYLGVFTKSPIINAPLAQSCTLNSMPTASQVLENYKEG
jgi:hypothetical protein